MEIDEIKQTIKNMESRLNSISIRLEEVCRLIGESTSLAHLRKERSRMIKPIVREVIYDILTTTDNDLELIKKLENEFSS